MKPHLMKFIKFVKTNNAGFHYIEPSFSSEGV